MHFNRFLRSSLKIFKDIRLNIKRLDNIYKSDFCLSAKSENLSIFFFYIDTQK